MRYAVYWASTAETHLTRIWLDSRNRAAVTAAASRLDERLARAPHDTGESRPGGFRIAFEWPLIATFRVDEEAKVVFVVDVWTR